MQTDSYSKIFNIHILWNGPILHSDAVKLNSPTDYGIYQFYGDHPIYGANSLLYIGKAQDQTFGRRISQHNWEMWTSSPVTIYIGKICSTTQLENSMWERQIDLAEKILLQSQTPSFNSSNLNKIGHIGEDTRILNWGMRKSLLPEISISRWEGAFAVGNNLKETFQPQTREHPNYSK